MKRTKRGAAMLSAVVVLAALAGLAGCEPVGYYDEGPGWDGDVYYGGYGWGYWHDHGWDQHGGAFYHDGGDHAGAEGFNSLGGHGGFHGGGGEVHGGGGGGGAHGGDGGGGHR